MGCLMDMFDNILLWVIVPAVGIALLAQLSMQTVYARSGRVAGRMSGYAVARQVLDGSGLYDVEIEQVPGLLSHHFDARRRVLQLSPDIYHGRHLTAAGIAAHEAGHAIQASSGFRWLVLREVAVPAASFGSGAGILLAVVGLILRFPPFLAVGILLFGGVMVLQLVNLPVELHASACADRMLVQLGIIPIEAVPGMRRVLRAAALTYVGETLQSVLTLIRYVVAGLGRRRDDT
ncbi:MAG: zinc metallopeptidase [Pirellulaceae bacterium]